VKALVAIAFRGDTEFPKEASGKLRYIIMEASFGEVF
jgi:hypothetical protein